MLTILVIGGIGAGIMHYVDTLKQKQQPQPAPAPKDS